MGHTRGRVTEIRLSAGRYMEAFITCPPGMVPQVGQYLLASDLDDPEAPLGNTLFLTEKSGSGFWAAPPIPPAWRPGTELDLVGPLGHGFSLANTVQRLGLVALGETAASLMPLVHLVSPANRSMTLFTDLPLGSIPSSLEVNPLSALPGSLDWPDFLAVDLPMERLLELRSLLGLTGGGQLSFPAQVLVRTAMPCAGLARCGACAVPAHRGWKLACEDGPVFDLRELKW